MVTASIRRRNSLQLSKICGFSQNNSRFFVCRFLKDIFLISDLKLNVQQSGHFKRLLLVCLDLEKMSCFFAAKCIRMFTVTY